MVDNGDAIVHKSAGPMRQINADSGLYIGEWLMSTRHQTIRISSQLCIRTSDVPFLFFFLGAGGVENTLLTKHTKFKGCISDFVLNSDYHVKLSWKQEDSILCEWIGKRISRKFPLPSSRYSSPYSLDTSLGGISHLLFSFLFCATRLAIFFTYLYQKFYLE